MSRSVMAWCAACTEYTLHDPCHRCAGPVKPRKPAKYSPEDPYGAYRRRLKKMERDA